MNFEFNKEIISNNLIEIEDIGNCTLEASNDLAEVYYLVIKSVGGMSYILKYGPIIPDLAVLPDEVVCNYFTTKFDQRKISKIITMFLNDTKAAITKAEIVDFDTFKDNFKDFASYMEEL